MSQRKLRWRPAAKKLSVSLFAFVFVVLIAELTLRCLGFQPAHVDEERYIQSARPDSFFVADPVLGWRLGTGDFGFYRGDSLLYTCSIDADGHRLTESKEAALHRSRQERSGKQIHLYGCSYTFGFSVADDCNYPYYLQAMLPNDQVCNKAVPGYSLLQIYLSLVQNVRRGDKPDVAVINFASFQVERSVLSRRYLRRLKWSINTSKKVGKLVLDLPYGLLQNRDSLAVAYLKWADWHQDYPLRGQSALVHWANTVLDERDYERHQAEYARIGWLTLRKTQSFCTENGIPLIFFGINPEAGLTLDSLSVMGAVTKTTAVDVFAPGNNCAPMDPFHPNAKAHKIFAQEVYDCLRDHHLMTE